MSSRPNSEKKIYSNYIQFIKDKNFSINLFDKGLKLPKESFRIESANTNFTTKGYRNGFHNFFSPTNISNNSSLYNSQSQSKPRQQWKYSYYFDNNNILNLQKIKYNNNSIGIKPSLYNFNDSYKPPVYSWSKPKMVKIIEHNKMIQEEVKTNFWKYSYLFENGKISVPGKLFQVMMNRLARKNKKKNIGAINLDINEQLFDKNIFCNQQWKVPGLYRKPKGLYDDLYFNRPKSVKFSRAY